MSINTSTNRSNLIGHQSPHASTHWLCPEGFEERSCDGVKIKEQFSSLLSQGMENIWFHYSFDGRIVGRGRYPSCSQTTAENKLFPPFVFPKNALAFEVYIGRDNLFVRKFGWPRTIYMARGIEQLGLTKRGAIVMDSRRLIE